MKKEESLSTYHHEGFGIWFDYPSQWEVVQFTDKSAADARGFLFAGCGNQETWNQQPVRVLNEDGIEVAALGRTVNRGCINVPFTPTVEVLDQVSTPLSSLGPTSFVYLTTHADDGDTFPVIGITGEVLIELVSPQVPMTFWAQSDNPNQRYELSFASTTSFSAETNSAPKSPQSSSLPGFADASSPSEYMKTKEYLSLKNMYLSARYQESADLPSGDLGLDQAMTLPHCDGTQIAVLGTSWTPSQYAAEIQQYLDLNPGTQYSRTDFLCTSFLRPALDNSDENYIYFVYKPTGTDSAITCEAVRSAVGGGNAHGKWLRNGAEHQRGEQVPC